MLEISVFQMPQKGKNQKAYKEFSFPLNFFMYLPLTLTDIPRLIHCNTGNRFVFSLCPVHRLSHSWLLCLITFKTRNER